MKIAASIFCMTLFAAAPEANRAYFTNLREVRVAEPQRQNWVAVDEEIWNHARADLGDLRMYSSEGEIPYLVRELSGGDRLSEFSARLLQLGTVAGRTSFFIDTSGAEEYNRVTLQLATRDFVGKAEVEGMDDIHSTQPTDLGTYSLYDFTRENLGSNFKLHLPDSRFKFLRVTLSKEVPSSDVKGATLAHWESEKAAFTAISATPNVQQEHKQTTITWQASQAVPLERIVIATSDINFRRSVQVTDEQNRYLASGEISRIRMTRNGQKIESENLTVDIPTAHASGYKVVLFNGDDPPLHIARVQPQYVTRRIYFDPRGNATAQLYYGDTKLAAPVYDYAKLFQADAEAAEAALGSGQHNAQYTARPDDRPWSEQHPAVLWIALLAAIAVLGAATLRGFKSNAQSA